MIAIKLFLNFICVLVSLPYYGLKFKRFVAKENIYKFYYIKK